MRRRRGYRTRSVVRRVGYRRGRRPMRRRAVRIGYRM